MTSHINVANARALNYARDLEHNRACNLALILNRAHELALTLELALALAPAHVSIRDLALPRARDRKLVPAPALTTPALTPAREVVRDLARDLHVARDLARDLNYVRDLDHDLNSAYALAHDLTLDLEVVRDLVHDLAFNLDRASASARALVDRLDVARAPALGSRDVAGPRGARPGWMSRHLVQR
ncbi:hypothetical protein, partial [Kutzneria viridogrisea]